MTLTSAAQGINPSAKAHAEPGAQRGGVRFQSQCSSQAVFKPSTGSKENRGKEAGKRGRRCHPSVNDEPLHRERPAGTCQAFQRVTEQDLEKTEE